MKWLEKSQLFRTAAKHVKMQPRNWQRTVFPWVGSQQRSLAMTQELVGKDREINEILNRQAALMENMPYWSFPPTLMLQPQVALCLDPQTSKELPGWKCKVLKNPNHSFSQSTDHCSAHLRPLWPKYDFIATTNCFHLFRFLKGHQAENPQPPTAVVCNVQSCGSCLHCTVTDKFNS